MAPVALNHGSPLLNILMNYDFNIDWLIANYKKIHWFGLGFIQLKIDDKQRIHFYTDKLPRTTTEEEIHNHRYNFTSTIVRGTLKQNIYEVNVYDGFTESNTHWLTEETCKENDKRGFPTYPCDIKLALSEKYKTGQSYYIHHDTFHQVSSNDAITLVKRGEYQKEFANIIFPVGMKPLCPFSVKRSENELWEIVRSLLE